MSNQTSVIALNKFWLRPWLAAAVLCGSLVSIGLVWATSRGGGIGLDFAVFWRAARTTNVYSPNPFDPFVYPPTTLLWLKPLCWLSFWPAFILWSLVSLVAYMAAARKWLLLGSPVVIQCLVFGQTSMILAAGILVAARSEGVVMGVILGLVFSLKPQLLVTAPLVLLLRRQWRSLSGFLIGAVVSVAFSVILFGPHVWLEWAGSIPAFRRVLESRDLWWVMITPYSVGMRLGVSPWPFLLMGCCVAHFAQKAIR